MTQSPLHAFKPAAAAAPPASGPTDVAAGLPARNAERDLRASLTYEPFYFLQEKPFSLSADPRFLFKSRGHALAFDELTGAIRRREGLVVLTGEIGTGKTTLCRAVLEQLDRRTFSAFVADPFLSREDLLKILLVEYGVVSLADLNAGRLQGWTRQELSYRLYEFLDSLVRLQAVAVLVVDEAQNLSLPLLEEIRILNDLERREKLLQVVLVGQPELRNRLKLPQLRQVEQRVAMRCELKPLGRDEVAAYVEHRLNVVRGSASSITFSPGAVDVVHHASAGVPRLINLICDRALHEAHRLSVSRRIEPAIVWKAVGALGIDVTPAGAPKDLGVGVVALDAAPVVPAAPPDASPGVPASPPTMAAGSGGTRSTSVFVEPIEFDDGVVIDAEFRPDSGAAEVQLELLLRQSESAAASRHVIVASGDDSMTEFKSESRETRSFANAAQDSNARGEESELQASAAAAAEEREHQALGGTRARRLAIAAGLVLAVSSAAGIPLAYDAVAKWAANSVPRLPPAPVFAMPAVLVPMVAEVESAAVDTGAPVDAAGAEADLPNATRGVSEAANAATAAPESYIVEIALFTTHERANRAVEELATRGYTAVTREFASGGTRFVQVITNAFPLRSDAETTLLGIRSIPGYADARVRAVSAP